MWLSKGPQVLMIQLNLAGGPLGSIPYSSGKVYGVIDTAASDWADAPGMQLLAEFGVFVDSYGRRSRTDDLKWSRLPLAFGK